jgi:eukaryotic-like serine/threonine-protein kinase
MSNTHVDRNLLFGILALQMEFVNRDQLIAAMHAWVLDKQKPLGQILVEHGALAADARGLIDALVIKHLELHQGDTRQSLAAIHLPGGVHRDLTLLADPDVEASLLATPQGAGGQATLPMGEQTASEARFEVLRPHAFGGLGEVFVARDREVKREVALKRLQERHAGNLDSRARFLREGEITGALEHPGIVPVYGLGIDHDGRPYYAMRFVRGETLKTAIERFHSTGKRDEIEQRIELRRLLARFIAVCDAIEYAHSRGIIHRDIKPSNIMLGKYGETLVVDWGLAKALGHREPTTVPDEPTLVPSSASGSSETLPGSAIGTPAYMSPEQASGRINDTGPTSDVYSLGATLYTILTGAEPFEARKVVKILAKVQAGDFVPPRERNKSVSQPLNAICLKAMSLSPTDRYSSCADLASDVEHWLADEPVAAWREPARVRAGRFVRKHRTAVATALATLVAAVIGLLAVEAVQVKSGHELAAKNRELKESNARLAEARDRAERRVELAVGAVENFRTAVDGNLDVKNRPENEGLRKTLLQAPLSFYQKLRDDLRAGGDVGAQGQAKLADAYLNLASIDSDIGSQSDALTAYGEAGALLDALVRAAPPAGAAKLRGQLAHALGDRGALESETKGMSAAAAASLQRAKEMWETAIRENPADVGSRVALAKTLDGLARLESRKENVDGALTGLRQGLGVLEEGRRQKPDNLDLGLALVRTHLAMSEILRAQRSRLPEALASAETARQIAEGLLRAHPGDVGCQTQLSQVYHQQGLLYDSKGAPDQALEANGKWLALVEKMIQVHPTVTRFKQSRGDALGALASSQTDLGRNAESLANLQRSRELLALLVSENPPNISFKRSLATTWNRMAGPLYALGRIPDALSATEACVALREEINRVEPDDVEGLRHLAGALYNVGLLSDGLGKTDAALSAYNRALAVQERLVRDHSDNPFLALELASTLGNMAIIHKGRKELSEARLGQERAVEILQTLVAAHPENVEFRNYLLRARANLAAALEAMGKSADALKVLTATQEACAKMVREHPGVLLYQLDLSGVSLTIGTTLRRQGKLDEAMPWIQKSIDILQNLLKQTPNEPQVLRELGSALTAQAELELDRKHPAAAVQSLQAAVRLFESIAGPSATQVYNLACCQARLAGAGSVAGSGMKAEEVRDTADKAMATLNRSVAAGYRDATNIRTDADLEAIRKRPDFEKLLKELEKK